MKTPKPSGVYPRPVQDTRLPRRWRYLFFDEVVIQSEAWWLALFGAAFVATVLLAFLDGWHQGFAEASRRPEAPSAHPRQRCGPLFEGCEAVPAVLPGLPEPYQVLGGLHGPRSL